MLKQADHLASYNALHVLEINAYTSTELVLSTWVYLQEDKNFKIILMLSI